jgi:hypothetical protein
MVQRPAYYDKIRRGWVNKYDFSAAAQYGEIVEVLRPGNLYADRVDTSITHMQNVFKSASFNHDDYILAIGDPIAIGAACAIACQMANGTVNILKYDRRTNTYNPFKVQIKV